MDRPRVPELSTPTPPAHLSLACADGDHSACLGTMYAWPPPEPGPDAVYLAFCGCTVCDHHHSAATRRGGEV